MGLFAIKLSAEVSAFLCLKLTKYCPRLGIWHLLVPFH